MYEVKHQEFQQNQVETEKRLKKNLCEIVPKPQTEPENEFVLFIKKKKKERGM